MPFTWDHNTPALSAGSFAKAKLLLRVEGTDPTDPTQDTAGQMSIADLISEASAEAIVTGGMNATQVSADDGANGALFTTVQGGLSRLGSLNGSAIGATSHTIQNADIGAFLNFTAATSVTVTIPSGLAPGAYGSIIQGGLGQVTVEAAIGVTINNADSQFSTQAQYVRLDFYAVPGSTDTYNLEGRTA